MITARLLAKLGLFSGLPHEELERLAGKAADIRLRPGDWLAREGERLPFVVILRGCLEVRKEIEGQEIHIDDLHAGEFFGEINALFGVPVLSSLSAKTACRIAAFEPAQLRELMEHTSLCGDVIRKELQFRMEDAPRFVMGLPLVRVRAARVAENDSLSRVLHFLKSNRISYENENACNGQVAAAPALFVDGVQVPSPVSERTVAQALGLSTFPARSAYDVVVVGGGPAGLAAAVYGASEGLRVLLVEKSAMGGQAGTSSRIENYLGFPNGIAGEDLADCAVRQAKRFGAELLLTRSVESIEKKNSEDYLITLDGDEIISTKTVVLTTGVHWRMLDAEGLGPLLGRGVSYGLAGVEPSLLAGKRVFLVGGGNSAGQAGMAMANYASSVTLLVRGMTLEATMSQYLIERLRSKKNIHIETKTTVTSVLGTTWLRTIRTTNDGVLSPGRRADALYILIGADASTDWLPFGLERDESGFIRTGRDVASSGSMGRTPLPLETSLPGVFCAGDVRHGSIKRVARAVGEGSMSIALIHQFFALALEGNQQLLPHAGSRAPLREVVFCSN
jgi:thioredoxin reductase (NADPH)